MRTVMKFEPRWDTRAAFRDFADHAPPVVPGADTAMDLLGQGAGGMMRLAGAGVGLASRLREVVR